jgi:arylsulfatase A-like enzyme
MTINYYYPHPPFIPPHEYRERYDADALPDPLFRESDLDAQHRMAAIDFQNVARRPETFQAHEVKAAYYGMIEYLDDLTGMLLDALERSGQRENTLIVFMSDHGETLGDHGLLEKGCRFYEGLVRVPLIFHWPGHFQQGVVSNALVELTDIVPTLLDVGGVPYPDKMMGRSLLPILDGQVGPDYHRDFVRCEYYRTLLPGEETGFEGTYATMIRDARYKLVVYHGHELGELFDLDADPGEFTNLWDDLAYSEVRFRLMLQSFDALAFAVDYGPKQILYS